MAAMKTRAMPQKTTPKLKMPRYLFILCGLALFGSCGRQPIEKFDAIDKMVWDYNTPQKFVVDIKEPGTYRVILQLRYNQEYDFSNIWVGLTETKPDGSSEKARFNIPLFDVHGRPYGSFAGRFYDRSYPDGQVDSQDMLSLDFPKPGKYTLSLQHNMRNDNLAGISEVGIRLKAMK
jgi:gliding motility-associated lipoprotein GldH